MAGVRGRVWDIVGSTLVVQQQTEPRVLARVVRWAGTRAWALGLLSCDVLQVAVYSVQQSSGLKMACDRLATTFSQATCRPGRHYLEGAVAAKLPARPQAWWGLEGLSTSKLSYSTWAAGQGSSLGS